MHSHNTTIVRAYYARNIKRRWFSQSIMVAVMALAGLSQALVLC
jgi:hypothetical protein